MVSLFWKKLTLINVAVVLIILRIYGYYLHLQEKKQLGPSLYPEEDDNGYPFFDQINCDLRAMFNMAYELGNTAFITEASSPLRVSSMTTPYQICKFNTKLLLCQSNAYCHNNLNHSPMISDNLIIWNHIDTINCFHSHSNSQCQSLPLFNNLITSFQTYKSLQEHQGNITYIKEHITSSAPKLNSLFHLMALTMKTSIEFNSEPSLQLNRSLYESTAQNCLVNTPLDTADLTEGERMEFFRNIDHLKEIISCGISNDDVALREIEAIEAVYKRNFDLGIDARKEKENVIEMMKGIIKVVDYLLKEEFRLKETVMNNDFDAKLFNVIYWGFCIMLILFINKYFLKNKEYYSTNAKTFFGKGKGYSPGSFLSRAINGKPKNNQQFHSSKKEDNYTGQVYTQEEIDRIGKLDTIDEANELIMTK